MRLILKQNIGLGKRRNQRGQTPEEDVHAQDVLDRLVLESLVLIRLVLDRLENHRGTGVGLLIGNRQPDMINTARCGQTGRRGQ